MKVAIIEDDKSIINAINVAFEFRWPDASVVSAMTGKEGIDLVKTEAPKWLFWTSTCRTSVVLKF